MKRSLPVIFILAFVGLFSTSVYAWEKIISCNNNAFVVDTVCYAYRGSPCYTRGYQFVINDGNILRYFAGRGALTGFIEGRGFAQPSSTVIAGGSHNFEVSADRNFFRTFTSIPVRMSNRDVNYLVEYTLRAEGTGLRLTATKVDDVRSDIVPRGELANWYFERCQKH